MFRGGIADTCAIKFHSDQWGRETKDHNRREQNCFILFVFLLVGTTKLGNKNNIALKLFALVLLFVYYLQTIRQNISHFHLVITESQSNCLGVH